MPQYRISIEQLRVDSHFSINLVLDVADVELLGEELGHAALAIDVFVGHDHVLVDELSCI